MKLTDEQLADFIRTTVALRDAGQAVRNHRASQSKIAKQRAEIKRLTEELSRVKQLADSRGKLILDIQKRAMQKQVDGA